MSVAPITAIEQSPNYHFSLQKITACGTSGWLYKFSHLKIE
ncbi:hypothetical protein X781_8480 [Mannheimia sp. USDA-ARS-USMARC-1261]|nr:hypothetical protein X781_8480 [Mannheimia sp. USDA-ARS-USMARC-1261]